MFISSKEKSNLYKLIADLQLRIVKLEKNVNSPALSTAIKNETYRKEYAKKYYWQKKAKSLAEKQENEILKLNGAA